MTECGKIAASVNCSLSITMFQPSAHLCFSSQNTLTCPSTLSLRHCLHSCCGLQKLSHQPPQPPLDPHRYIIIQHRTSFEETPIWILNANIQQDHSRLGNILAQPLSNLSYLETFQIEVPIVTFAPTHTPTKIPQVCR